MMETRGAVSGSGCRSGDSHYEGCACHEARWAERLAAAEARVRRLEAALRGIADDDCTSYRESGRTCEWLGQKWPDGYCYPCIARAALTPPPEAEKKGGEE